MQVAKIMAWRTLGQTSGPTLLKRRVEPFQLDTGVGRREVPVGLGIVGIATCLPGIDFTREHLGIRDAPVEALAGEDGQLGFGEVQPATVLGRVMPFEPLDQAARLGRLENLVERGIPGAPHPVATGRHWPRSTFRSVLLHWGSHADDALNAKLLDAIA